MTFNPLDYPVCYVKPQRLTEVNSWHEHIPFAFAVMQMLKPKIFVELGTHNGDSYCAFCQAVEALGLDTACYAVDTWEGDEQSGYYGPEILEKLRAYHNPLYGRFSRLIQSRFDQALDHFSDGSVDLLHIDGLHTHDAAKHDFESWLPKMSTHGVILLHDINVRERGFGVWLLWEELIERYPSFEFKHGHGLGVLAIGTAVPEEVLAFLDMAEHDKTAIPKFFSYLGSKTNLENQLQRKDARVNELTNALQTKDARIKTLETSLLEKNARVIELTNALQTKDARIKTLETSLLEENARVIELTNALESIQRSIIWQLLMKFHNGFIERVFHPGTRRRRWYDSGLNSGRNFLHKGWRSWFKHKNKSENTGYITENKENFEKEHIRFSESYKKTDRTSSVKKHGSTVDIIICVHNALIDVKKCLESVIKHTKSPYSLILVDDGSAVPTKSYLEDFAERFTLHLIRNEIAKGYTIASNQGLRSSIADYVVLLNSDTIVAHDWLDRMIECAESDDKVGIVGPLSNTASWQSVPEIEENSDWAQNILPPDISVEQMGRLIARYSARLYPEIPFLNGFCLLIKRVLINDIGYFDEELFGKGYGEENDYCIRARKAQWKLRIADDVYIYHAQSRSYSNETRKELCKIANEALVKKHGQTIISEGVFNCRYDRALEGIRARTKAFFFRQQLISEANNRWGGKQILIILPVIDPGGGAYVVIQERRAMLEMGVFVCLMNLKIFKEKFELNYPDLESPVIYSQPDKISIIAKKFDAVIATANTSVAWLESVIRKDGIPIRGYYVQDFEPHFYPEGSKEFAISWESYTKFPDLIRITKTKWNKEIVKEKIGVNCQVVGPSVDIDLFRPRQRNESDSQNRTVYVGAMIRPSTPRRASLLTMNILREVWRHNRNKVKIITFGCERNELNTLNFSKDFNYHHIDVVISRKELASLLNEIDIFVDFSSHQAMGLTALEAMACGATVIVPQAGGSKEFVKHELNGLVVDTSSEKACFEALNRLVSDDELRIKLGRQALKDACQYPPEKAAFNTLMEIFKQSNNIDLLSDRQDLIPPEEMIFVGPGDFKQIGNEFLKYFIELGNLKPNEQVLDVGCGIGRMAIPLTRYLDKNGSYEGFDIVSMGINWCKKNISIRYPHFHFQLADIFNKFYNQDGRFKASEYKFPFKDETFDFIFLASVFTHMLPEDMENYFTEIARVLKKSGGCLITFFLINEESRRFIKAKKSTQDFKFEFNGYHTVDENNPEGAVAYEEKTIRMLFEKHGFTINEPIRFGSWCGRQNFLSYQDIIVALKGGTDGNDLSARSD